MFIQENKLSEGKPKDEYKHFDEVYKAFKVKEDMAIKV